MSGMSTHRVLIQISHCVRVTCDASVMQINADSDMLGQICAMCQAVQLTDQNAWNLEVFELWFDQEVLPKCLIQGALPGTI